MLHKLKQLHSLRIRQCLVTLSKFIVLKVPLLYKVFLLFVPWPFFHSPFSYRSNLHSGGVPSGNHPCAHLHSYSLNWSRVTWNKMFCTRLRCVTRSFSFLLPLHFLSSPLTSLFLSSFLPIFFFLNDLLNFFRTYITSWAIILPFSLPFPAFLIANPSSSTFTTA